MNKNILMVTVSCLGVLIISGCGLTAAKGLNFTSFGKPKENKSTLYVYRPEGFSGHAINYAVYAFSDKEKNIRNGLIGVLKHGGFVTKEVDPGKTLVWAETESRTSLGIDVKANKTYCIKAGISMGWAIGTPSLELVDMKTCQEEIQATKGSY